MKDEIKKGVLLTAINVCRMQGTAYESLTIDKEYEVLGVNYNEDEFFITDDDGHQHYFGISDYTDFFKSLSNNGWIKIESKNDLPKIEGYYWVVDKNETSHRVIRYTNNSYTNQMNDDWWLKFITHYQPIEIPKPPIY